MADAERAEKRQILVDDVARGIRIDSTTVEQTGGRLAEMPSRQSDRLRGARCACEHGRLDQPLQIQRSIVTSAPQIADHSEQSRTRTARVHTDPSGKNGHEIEHFDVARIDEPVDLCIGMRRTQRRSDRNPVNHVAKRSQANDQEPLTHGSWLVDGRWWMVVVVSGSAEDAAMRASRSRVE
jgi:hypothetical protein